MSKVCFIYLLLVIICLPAFSDYEQLWESEVGDPQGLYVIGVANIDLDVQPEIVYIDHELYSDYPYYIWVLDSYTGEIEWQSDEFYHIYTEQERAPRFIDTGSDNRFQILMLAEAYPGEPYWILLGYDISSGVGTGSYTTKSLTKLSQNSPNPMSKQTKIEFSLASPQQSEIKIYNSTGTIVRTINCGKRGIGNHTINWNGTDNNGKKLPAGTYFYILNTEDAQLIKKAIIIE
jgi:hypothetical protein